MKALLIWILGISFVYAEVSVLERYKALGLNDNHPTILLLEKAVKEGNQKLLDDYEAKLDAQNENTINHNVGKIRLRIKLRSGFQPNDYEEEIFEAIRQKNVKPYVENMNFNERGIDVTILSKNYSVVIKSLQIKLKNRYHILALRNN